MNFKSLRSIAAFTVITLTAVAANALTLKEVTPSISEPISELPGIIYLHFDANADLPPDVWNDPTLKKVSLLNSAGQVITNGTLDTNQDWSNGWPPITDIKIVFDSSISSPGVYTLDIPAGRIIEDGNESNTSSALHIQWTVGSGNTGSEAGKTYVLPYDITPANGSTVEKIGKNDIWVWYNEDLWLTDEAYADSSLNTVSLKDASGKVVATSEMLWEQRVNGKGTNFQIKFPQDITDDGIYSLTIPKGILVSESDDTIFNDEVNLSYTVYNPDNHTGVLMYSSIVPPNNSEVEYLGTNNIFVYFNGYVDLSETAWESVANRTVAMTDQTGATVASIILNPLYDSASKRGYLNLLLPADIEAPGTYTVTIPAGILFSEADPDNKNEEIILRWTIKDPSQGSDDTNCSYTLEYVKNYPVSSGSTYDFAAQGNSPLDMVLVTWENNSVCNPAVKPYIEDANGNRTMSTIVSDFDGDTRILFDANQTKLWKSGKYTLVLPKGLAGTSAWKASGYTEDVCNPEVKVTFNYVQDPSMEAGEFEEELEMTKIGFYDFNSETNETICLADFLPNPETVANITGGDNVRLIIGANVNEIAKDIYVEIRDDSTDEYLWGANTWYQAQGSVTDIHTMNGKNADGEFEIDFTNSNFTLEFLRDHDYSLNISWYEKYDGVAEAARICYANYIVRFKGTTRGYEYSDAKIVSVSLPEGSDIGSVEEAAVSITFSEPVNISTGDLYTRFVGSGTSAYESVTSNADRTVWTLTPKASALNSCEGVADYRLAPRDDQGRALRSDVYYTSGQKDATFITISYNCFLGGKEIDADPADGSTVNDLYSFTFKVKGASGAAANIGYNGISASGKMVYGQLFDSNGELVGTLDRTDVTTTPSGEYDIDLTMHLENKVTTPGEYTLRLPGALFMCGTESASKASRPMQYAYTVEGAAPAKTTCTFTYIIDDHSAITHEVAKGSTVAIKIAPADNYEIAELTLNGEKQAFNGNRYVTPALNDDEATLNLAHRYANDVMFDFTTGVETVAGCDFKVVNVADGVDIYGLTGNESIYVFNTAGVEIARKHNNGNLMEHISLDHGIYVIAIDKVTLKIRH